MTMDDLVKLGTRSEFGDATPTARLLMYCALNILICFWPSASPSEVSDS